MTSSDVAVSDHVIIAVARAALLVGPPVAPLAALAARGWSAPDKAACGLGVLSAPLLLATLRIDHFNLTDVFASGGPWDLGYTSVIEQRLLPLLAAPLDLLGALAVDASPDLRRLAALLATAVLLLALPPPPWRRDKWHAGLSGIARRLFLVLWSSYATLYLVSIVAWTANRLNFWCFLVLLLASLLARGD